MNKRIEPDLFARLMKLPSRTRQDILEYFGQTPVASDDALRLVASAAKAASMADRMADGRIDKG